MGSTNMDGDLAIRLRPALTSEIDELMDIDDDAAALFLEAGIDFSDPAFAAFALAERARWLAATEQNRVELALDGAERVLGFIALGFVDGQPYLDQLSVRRRFMRRGVGRTLLARAVTWSEAFGDLWLTTYAHLAWNAPMYRRAGFVPVAEARCGAEMKRILREQRMALPAPEQRIAMVHERKASTG
jgi:GNAT superfamily N-acetyltransferase